ncbi:hypothetical protein O181_035999 [Austropuccinia psidii MF-1]|uniref:Uncharacterized protein n=1 Tax=Austropuccinia psidii MF-1 TaxID=1389203 RepID=A0A9Q3HB40_9BASI|nr:hypothetical protein [Austropuccinia psidii MF-1]
MRLIYYIDELLIDVPTIPDFWIAARLDKEFKGHSSMWCTQMKEIHGRGKWKWWNILIIQNYSNVNWRGKKIISFENDIYSADKDPYEWCLKNYKIFKSIDPKMNIQMRKNKLLTQLVGELEHAVKFMCSQSFTLDEIFNTLEDLRKRKDIGKYSQ